jgi:ribosome-associated heat shock protein Hsp15
MTADAQVRLDKWLWAARFFKTRSLAAEAISGGKIHLNGARTKPAHGVKTGEVLSIRRGPYEYLVVVKGLSKQRGPASRATQLYEETPESLRKRATLAAQLKLESQGMPRPAQRPTKKDRRRIVRFTQR